MVWRRFELGLLRRLLGESHTDRPAAPLDVSITLFEGEERLEVKGESYHQESLQRVVEKFGREVTAILVPEPDNQYDSNAVSCVFR